MDNEYGLLIAGLIAKETMSNFDLYRDVLLAVDGNAQALVSPEAEAVLGGRFVKRLEQALLGDSSEYEAKVSEWQAAGITTVPIGSKQYPLSLMQINDPPPLLWVKGRLDAWFSESKFFTIVGSRKASIEACEIACTFAEQIVSSMPIVSGLALGIDAAAHRGSLRPALGVMQNLVPGIAVLGNGVDAFYPPRNAALADLIIQNGGLVISQFAPGTPPFPSNFLNRNRVIAGLSCAGLIVQAGARSGSLNTARHLVEQGKDVFVIPGSIRFSGYEGSHSLLKDGAVLVTTASEILESLGVAPGGATPVKRTIPECSITKALKDGALTVYELQDLLSSEGSVLSRIIQLESSGVIAALPGDKYALVMGGH
jgi:DNA processing protein